MRLMFELLNRTIQNKYKIVEALDKLFILHADHETNCSTSVQNCWFISCWFICVYSWLEFPALWGPLHGGSNYSLEMLEEISKMEVMLLNFVLLKCKSKEDPFSSMVLT
jgi:citrate synthase